LYQWLCDFPQISLWLVDNLPIAPKTNGVSTPELHWKVLKTYGIPPELSPEVFLINREKAKDALLKITRGESTQLVIETRYPDEGIDFIAAFLSILDAAKIGTSLNRFLIIDNPDTWTSLCSIRVPHIFIAKPSLDLGGNGIDLCQLALSHKHSIIYSSVPQNRAHGNTIQLVEAKPFELAKVLEVGGYTVERARNISDKCAGKIPVLKRLLQNLSASPDWASSSYAAELAIASLIGRWDGNLEGDREAVEGCLGKTYGEWLRVVRPTTVIPDPPLIQRDEKWKFVSRYEGWQNLGSYLSDDDLKRFKLQALTVLCEKDPKFTLEPEERWKASLHNKKNKYSNSIKEGFAETLSLLGSYPDVLSSCTVGFPTLIAKSIVREIFDDADWVTWASLNDILPLLAEAAPDEFLNAIEKILIDKNNKTFQLIFAQEGSGFLGGWNFITGILWALETLAWHKDYLSKVTILLGQLSEIDPGGNWANRPINSLTTIFLPWLPQTCANLEKRKAAIKALLIECPTVGWKLLSTLLPNIHFMTTGSRRPVWREFIPIDHSETITNVEYIEQVGVYAGIMIQEAGSDLNKISDLIEHLDELPERAFTQILNHLSSKEVVNCSEQERLVLWEKLINLITKHKKFSDATWALPKEEVEKISQIAITLKPSSPHLLYRRLFNEHETDLIEQEDDYEVHSVEIKNRRISAIKDLLKVSGIEGVMNFAQSIVHPIEIGLALGSLKDQDYDSFYLPAKIITEDVKQKNVLYGYVVNRFQSKGWGWVDGIDMRKWTDEEKASFFIMLPFVKETWKRVNIHLTQNELLYWTSADARPYELEDDIQEAIALLLHYNRPHAAIHCLDWMRHKKKDIPLEYIYQALLSGAVSKEPVTSINQHAITELIKYLQNNPNTDKENISKIEWLYLRLLDRHFGQVPKTLEQQLADEPEFFCEVIRIVFKSDNEKNKSEEITEERRKLASHVYELLGHWQIPPGTLPDGSFDLNRTNKWISEVKLLCQKSGHLRIALNQVGKVFAHYPLDPSGLWIHKGIAQILNEKDADIMRSAFTIERFNMRGVHGWTAGSSESEIASDWRKKADAVEKEGFVRFATSLREFAASYEHEALREASRDPYED
jgi:hypothetical protein